MMCTCKTHGPTGGMGTSCAMIRRLISVVRSYLRHTQATNRYDVARRVALKAGDAMSANAAKVGMGLANAHRLLSRVAALAQAAATPGAVASGEATPIADLLASGASPPVSASPVTSAAITGSGSRPGTAFVPPSVLSAAAEATSRPGTAPAAGWRPATRGGDGEGGSALRSSVAEFTSLGDALSAALAAKVRVSALPAVDSAP